MTARFTFRADDGPRPEWLGCVDQSRSPRNVDQSRIPRTRRALRDDEVTRRKLENIKGADGDSLEGRVAQLSEKARTAHAALLSFISEVAHILIKQDSAKLKTQGKQHNVNLVRCVFEIILRPPHHSLDIMRWTSTSEIQARLGYETMYLDDLKSTLLTLVNLRLCLKPETAKGETFYGVDYADLWKKMRYLKLNGRLRDMAAYIEERADSLPVEELMSASPGTGKKKFPEFATAKKDRQKRFFSTDTKDPKQDHRLCLPALSRNAARDRVPSFLLKRYKLADSYAEDYFLTQRDPLRDSQLVATVDGDNRVYEVVHAESVVFRRLYPSSLTIKFDEPSSRQTVVNVHREGEADAGSLAVFARVTSRMFPWVQDFVGVSDLSPSQALTWIVRGVVLGIRDITDYQEVDGAVVLRAGRYVRRFEADDLVYLRGAQKKSAHNVFDMLKEEGVGEDAGSGESAWGSPAERPDEARLITHGTGADKVTLFPGAYDKKVIDHVYIVHGWTRG